MSARRAAPEVHRVVVLAGGLSYEREVSLRSGRRVCEALRATGVDAAIRDADDTMLAALTEQRPDAVFVALHGGAGEDGALRGVLELLEVPYVGSRAQACRTAFDKPTAKAVVRAAGVVTPDWIALPQSTFRELGAPSVLDRIVARFGLPLMVKPAQGGSALGATRVDSAAELPAAMVHCFSYGDTALIERYAEGVELAVSVVDVDGVPTVLPPVEVVAEDAVFDYAARYTAGATQYYVPSRLPDDVLAAAGDVASRAHDVLGLRHLSRTDLVVTPDGGVHFLEVNVSPGMTETSLLPMSVDAAGLNLGTVCASLLADAVTEDA